MNIWITSCALLLAGICGFEICIGCLTLEGAVEFKKEGVDATAAFVFGIISLSEASLNGFMAICLVTACNEAVFWKAKIIVIKIWSIMMTGSLIVTSYYAVTAYKTSQGYVYVVVKVMIIWCTILVVFRYNCVIKERIRRFHVRPATAENATVETSL